MGTTYRPLAYVAAVFALCAGAPFVARAATLSVGPATGSFQVGSTFDVSVFLDTEGESVNTISLALSFPPETLQLVAPSAGNSIIGIWSAQPQFNNIEGRVEFQGGVPGGTSVSKGLISTLTFRVRSVGSGLVRFLDSSRVLLNDGRGTDALRNTSNGFYQFVLPPPAGPIVISETHQVQSEWYANPNVVLAWEGDVGAQGYSYVVNEDPVDTPDDISEGRRNTVTYRGMKDGTHYFHIKALRDGTWGGTTHFAIHIDTTPPADFPISISPSARTVRQQPIIQFSTTDANSGIDHYELKVVPLSLDIETPSNALSSGNEAIFIEAQSPYLSPTLQLGTYDVIVRSYDKAKNYREVSQRLAIVSQIIGFVDGQGLSLMDQFVVPWNVVWGVGAFLLSVLALAAWRIERRHKRIVEQRAQREFPDAVRRQLEELQHYREKYGKTLALFLAAAVSVAALLGTPSAHAEEVSVSPPIITTVSRNISNDEIFYVGGKTEAPQTDVLIYLQDLRTGETSSIRVVSDSRNDWFYRHYTFLASGRYLLWAQAKIGEVQSPPSPQVQFSVEQAAFQIGATRVSTEAFYVVLVVILGAVLLALTILIILHGVRVRRNRSLFMKEIREAEESIRRGFAVLRRDIEAELAVVRRAGLTKALSSEERAKEAQLLKDLDLVERYIGKEVWDVERIERSAIH
jgi:hypothetical protein